jgi:protein ImuA
VPSACGQDMLELGVRSLDQALGGGLQRGRLHELYPADKEGAASAAGFAAMLAVRLGGPVMWLRSERSHSTAGALYAPGLREIGLDPAQLLVAVLPDTRAVLRAAGDVVRCPEVGATIVELWGRAPELGLTESRRLALAAEASRNTVLMLRPDAEPRPSAAQTRWSVKPAVSTPLDANAPGYPAMVLELLRQRGRPDGGTWCVEWDREENIFREQRIAAPLSGAVVPVSGVGSGEAGTGLRRTG